MNTNCLEGMKCPECGSERPFDIIANVVARVTDEGVEHYIDPEWDNSDYCYCVNCNHEGNVGGFKICKP